MDAAARVRWLLWNDAERRPRAGWRILVAVLALIGGAVAGAVAGSLVAASAPAVAPPAVTAVVDAATEFLLLGAYLLTLLAVAWVVDRRRLADLGLGHSRAWWADLAFGLTLGMGLPALVFAVEWLAGWVTVTGWVVTRTGETQPVSGATPPALSVAITAVYFLGVGLVEELLFRGYLLGNLAEGLRGLPRLTVGRALAIATAVTSGLFGLGHLLNPAFSALAVVTITLYGGLLAAGYLLTGRLAIPIGFHAAWNLAISSVFGFPVSGLSTPVTLIGVAQSGPPLVTGGRFGPEAGLVSLLALAAGLAALVWWVRWRHGRIAVDGDIARPTLRGVSDDEDVSVEDPPGEDSAGEGPPAENPPGEDGSVEDPPAENPPGEDAAGEDPPGKGPTS